MSLDTTRHVRVFRGSAPTEGSQLIHRRSPRWTSMGSPLFITEQLQLWRFKVAEQLPRVRTVGGVVGGEPGTTRTLFPVLECLAQESSCCCSAWRSRRLRVLCKLVVGCWIECQIHTCHDAMNSTPTALQQALRCWERGDLPRATARGQARRTARAPGTPSVLQ